MKKLVFILLSLSFLSTAFAGEYYCCRQNGDIGYIQYLGPFSSIAIAQEKCGDDLIGLNKDCSEIYNSSNDFSRKCSADGGFVVQGYSCPRGSIKIGDDQPNSENICCKRRVINNEGSAIKTKRRR